MDEIKHHGVKGMKWGVRKDSKKLSDMSDQELRDYNNRKKLENEYKRLSNPILDKYTKGVVGIATASAAAVTVATIQKYGKQAFSEAMLYALGIKI